MHEFELAPDAKLSDIVQLIISAEKLDPDNARVRIISSGRLFTDHAIPVKDVVSEGGFLHCAVTEGVNEANTEVDTAREGEFSEQPLVLEATDVDGEVRIIIPSLYSGGFERLSAAGFSEGQIRRIRRIFRLMRREARERMRRGDIEEGNVTAIPLREVETGESEDENALAAATRRPWRSDARLILASGVEGTNSDFLMGCIFGYLLGIIVLVLLLDSGATRRSRVGLVAGVATNCAFGILRTSLFLEGGLTTP